MTTQASAAWPTTAMHWRGDRTGGNDAPSAQPDSGTFDEGRRVQEVQRRLPWPHRPQRRARRCGHAGVHGLHPARSPIRRTPSGPRQLPDGRRAGRAGLLSSAASPTASSTATAATCSIATATPPSGSPSPASSAPTAATPSRASRRCSRSRTCATSTRRSHVRHAPDALHGASSASSSRTTPASPVIRCAASASCTTRRRHVLPLPRRDGLHPDPDEPDRHTLRPGGPADPPPTRAVHCSPSTATWRRLSASRDPGPDQRDRGGRAHRSAHGAAPPWASAIWWSRAASTGRSAGFLYDGRAGSSATAGASPPSPMRARLWRTTAGQELTYTCVPPGSGKRIGIDRTATHPRW